MSKGGLAQLYRKISSSVLDLVVKPTLIGEVPNPHDHAPQHDSTDEQPHHRKKTAVCYVLQNHSRSNALLVDSEARRLKLPSLYDPLILEHKTQEKVAFFYLQHPYRQQQGQYLPPRLLRLIEFVQQHDDWDIDLVPVTILWGRAPDKEDSLFKLLFTDTWATPSTFKQLMNIGLHGRDTYIEFHEKCSLRAWLATAQEKSPNISPATYMVDLLNKALDSKREAVLGPDLSDRRNVMYSLIKSPDVQDAIRKESIRDKIGLHQAEQRAISYVNEIASDYSASTVRFAEVALNRLWTQLYDGVEVHHFQQVRDLAPHYELVYVPCHRSHIDYLLLSFVIFKRGLRIPYIAAGDNLNLPFVGQLLRGGGAFFIRRSFRGNALYTSVFKQYLYSVIARNTPLEYFIEGGRSRTGRLLAPKTGMLAMTAHAHFRTRSTNQPSKPIVFIPTYIGYERLMEGSTYIGEMQGKPKESESILGILQTVRKIERIFGKVHVNFGEPIFLDDILKQHQAENIQLKHNDDPMPTEASHAVHDVAYQILQNINRAVVINPVSLLSLALLSSSNQCFDEALAIKLLDVYRQILQAHPYDKKMQITALTGREILDYAIQLKFIQRTPDVLGNTINIDKEQAVLLTYFRNNILHAYILPALIATLVQRNGQISQNNLIEVIETLYPFLKAELFLKWQLDELRHEIEQYVQVLANLQLISINAEQILTSPMPNSELHQLLTWVAGPVQQSLSRYYMTVMLIQQRGSGAISSKQVEDLSHLLGQRLSNLYHGNSPEFFDKALFQGFLKELFQLKYIQNNDKGLIVFDEQIQNMANYANLVLDDSILNLLQKITNLTEDELQQALAQVASQNAKRRAKRKK